MSINREMLQSLKSRLRRRRNNISSFGVELKLNFYNKRVISPNKTEAIVLKEDNKIKAVEVVRASLTNSDESNIYTIHHNKKMQRTRKARR